MAFRLSPSGATWSKDDSQAYLKANPLPVEFRWPHRDHRDAPDGGLRPVQPAHKSVESYGKWLRETPYFPGLFELAHEILAAAPDLGDADWLASELSARRSRKDTPELL
jgi:hypothetical protein